MAWNGSDRGNVKNIGGDEERKQKTLSSPSTHPFNYRALAAGLIVVALCGAAVWLFLGPFGRVSLSDKSDEQKVKPATATKIAAAIPATDGKRQRPDATPAEALAALPQKLQEKVAAIATNLPPQFSSNCVTRPVDPNDPNAHLSIGVNQELGVLLSTELGEEPIPFPYSFLMEEEEEGKDPQKEEFLKSVKKKIVFSENDTPEQKAHKANMLQSRLEILDSLDSGKGVTQTIKEAYEHRVYCYECRKALSEDLSNWVREYDPTTDEFDKMLKTYNDKLGESGIKAIDRDEVLPEDVVEAEHAEKGE